MMTIKDDTFNNLRSFIYEKCGIYIPDTRRYFIENRLSRLVEEKKMSSFEDYFYLLRYSADQKELNDLYDKITTNETFFFRESKQLDICVNELVPKIKDVKRLMPLKIWSAACSTGEEPYTLAMMLMENPKTNLYKIEIYASDISESVLTSAKNAEYSQYSVRNVPENYKKKYFKQNSANNHTLNSQVTSRVKFMQINLFDKVKARIIRSMDIIFCRNILIYFDKKAKISVVSHLYDSLNPGGYLIIGMSESLHDITRAFRPKVINKTLVYQKV